MQTYDETMTEILGVQADYESGIKAVCFKVLGGCPTNQDVTYNVLTEIVMELLEKRNNGLTRAIAKAKESDDPAMQVRKVICNAARFRARRSPKRFGNGLSYDEDSVKSVVDNKFHADQTPDVLDAILFDERDQTIRDAVRNLASGYRECIEAFYFQQKSILEISNDLEVPEGTVKRRLFVGRTMLQEMLDASV